MKKHGAFTLFELLISMAILSIIAYLSTSSFISMRKIVDVNRANEEVLRNIRSFLESLDVEISGAILVGRAEETLFVSKRTDIMGENVNNLIFTTISPQQYLEIGKRDEVIKVEYEVKENEDNPDLLVVTKKVYYHILTDERSQEPVVFDIRNDFTDFMLRFYRQGKWHDTWDSTISSQLPERVELTFSLGGTKYREYFNVYISEM
jgi:type II secretion system protein J